VIALRGVMKLLLLLIVVINSLSKLFESHPIPIAAKGVAYNGAHD